MTGKPEKCIGWDDRHAHGIKTLLMQNLSYPHYDRGLHITQNP